MTRLLAALFAALAFCGSARAVEIVLTAGTTWTVPADWNSLANTVEVIGAGGTNIAAGPSNGGGGGAYAKSSNFAFTAGQIVTVQIGAASATAGVAQTCFVSCATLMAAGSINQNGALAGSSVGTVKFNGGSSAFANNGGGGAAGRNGAGSNSVGPTGGQGDNGTGGAGGAGSSAGAAGTEMGSVGAGGGGGNNGGAGGLYGGGGGANFGVGAPGVIVINYQPYRRTGGGIL